MRFFLASCKVSGKTKLSSHMLWVLLLLLVLLLVATGVLSQSDSAVMEFSAGVVYNSANPFSSDVVETLSLLEIAEFVPLPDIDPEQMPTYITSREFSVVYYLPDDLLEQMLSGKLEGAVLSVVSPSSGESTFLDKWIFSACLVKAAPYISADELSKTLGVPYEDISSFTEESYQWYGKHQQFVVSEVHYADIAVTSRLSEKISPIWSRIFLGMLALVLFFFVFSFLSVDITHKKEVFLLLSAKQQRLFALAEMATTFLIGEGTALFTLGTLFFLGFSSFLFPFFAFTCYLFCLAALGGFVTKLLSSTEGLTSAGIFLFLFVITLGGVLFDPFEVSTWLGRIGALFPTWHLLHATLTGSVSALLPLLLTGIVCLLLLWFFYSPKQKKAK